MPWNTKADVARHNKKASKNPTKRRVWKKVANGLIAKGTPEGQAIREANSVADRIYKGKKPKGELARG